MDAHDEDVLVVGAVEDADLALARDAPVDAPEVVVGELLGRRDLERGDGTALRVERAHHVAERAVLAGGVDSLEDDEDLMLALGPEPVLEIRQPGEAGLELLGRGVLRPPVGRRRIDLRQVDARARTDAEGGAQVGGGRRAIGPSAVG